MPLSDSRRSEQRFAMTGDDRTLRAGAGETDRVADGRDLGIRLREGGDGGAATMTSMEEARDASPASAVIVTPVNVVVSVRVNAVHHGM